MKQIIFTWTKSVSPDVVNYEVVLIVKYAGDEVGTIMSPQLIDSNQTSYSTINSNLQLDSGDEVTMRLTAIGSTGLRSTTAVHNVEVPQEPPEPPTNLSGSVHDIPTL